ncbi:MAG: PKD domain-containing protein [Saprospiraceae bacterium]|nr:PKD domain-containing protein [Saprospiraceae bacterium]
MRTIFTLLVLLTMLPATAQKHDEIWLLGYGSNAGNSSFGGTVIDFATNPPDMYYEYRSMNFSQVNASICDTSGNLLFYTNGIYIANALNEPMENGQGLNPGLHAQQNQEYGYILDQGAMILPAPEHDSLYYLLHMDKELNLTQTSFQSSHFYYTIVNINDNNGLGKVTSKNQALITDTFHKGKLVATRHANGRDWWILVRRYGTNLYYKVILSVNGLINLGIQSSGNAIPSNSIGQAVFSPDGSKYANVHIAGYAGDPIYVSIYDFDRCSGTLSNSIQFTYADTAWCAGIAISPNNRFLYVSSFRYIYQYDLQAPDIEASRITVAEWDGFAQNGSFATTFYLAQLAPDGKIYITSNSSVSYLHVINHPDSLGLACDVCQHCVELPTWNAFSLPNFPNYRLHHLEGSPCDTLRQPPTSAWSYDAQALELAFQDSSYHDIRAWHWDFGDGVTDTVPHPVHTYAAEGVYNVCLTVSNPRGADTLCREVQVLINIVADTEGSISVSISPNPVTNGVALLQLEALVKLDNPQVIIRDALAREVLREPLRVVAGKVQQEMKIGHLAAGVYFCSVEDSGVVVWQGKVVKQ